MRSEQSVLVHGFELVCATKSCALREVRSRIVHREVATSRSLYGEEILRPSVRREVKTDGRSPRCQHCPVPPKNGIEADARGLDRNDRRASFVATATK